MDETAAREAAEQVDDGIARMGLDGPIPDQYPGHKPPGIEVELRRFPGSYVTPEVRELLRLHDYHAAGHKLLDDAVLHWPAPLPQALELIGREKQRRAHAS